MKVELREKDNALRASYPYVGVTKGGIIILFVGANMGTCLRVGNDKTTFVGDFSNEWGEELFHPYTGEVVLSND